jgi:hypothetical protein
MIPQEAHMKHAIRLCTPNILARSEKAATGILFLMMAGCCIFGSGRVLSFGDVGLRMLLLAVLMVVSLPLIISQWRQLAKNRYIQLVALFFLWLVLSAVIGFARGNDSSLLLTDLKGFGYFLFLIPALCVLNSHKRILGLMKLILYSSGVLALLHIGTFISYLIDPFRTEWFLLEFLQSHLGWLDKINFTMTRLFFRSVVYLICGCGFALYFYVYKEKKLLYPMLAGLCLFAILLSYTRSIYFGVAIAAFLCIVCILLQGNAQQRKRLISFAALTLTLFLLITAVFSLTQKEDYLGFAFDRVFSLAHTPTESAQRTLSVHPLLASTSLEDYLESSKESDLLRAQTIEEMVAKFWDSPLFGSGLGIHWDVRAETGGISEYFYLDLLAKTGIIGFVLYLSPILYTVFLWLKKGTDPTKMIWMNVLFGFLAVSYFNPYMNSSLGILFYCCSISAFCANAPQPQTNI